MEVGHRQEALAAGSPDHGFRAEHVTDGGEVLGRVGLAERAADGSPVPHNRIGDHGLGVPDDGEERRDFVRLEERGVPGQGADAQFVAVAQDEVEFVQVIDVDQPLGPGEPELHHRQEAVAPGDDPRFRAVAREEFECVVHGRGPHVVERSRNLHSPYLTPGRWQRRAAPV